MESPTREQKLLGEVSALIEGQTVRVVNLQRCALLVATVATQASTTAPRLLGSDGNPTDGGLLVGLGDGVLPVAQRVVGADEVAELVVRALGLQQHTVLPGEAQRADVVPAGGVQHGAQASVVLVQDLMLLAARLRAGAADLQHVQAGAAAVAPALGGVLGDEVRAMRRGEGGSVVHLLARNPATALLNAGGPLADGLVLGAVGGHEVVGILNATANQEAALVLVADQVGLSHALWLGNVQVHASNASSCGHV